MSFGTWRCISAGSKWSRWRCEMYRKSALPNRAQSRLRLSGNGNHDPKKVGPMTGSHRMLPPAVSMNIPAWPRPVMRMDSSRVEQLPSLRGASCADRAVRRKKRDQSSRSARMSSAPSDWLKRASSSSTARNSRALRRWSAITFSSIVPAATRR